MIAWNLDNDRIKTITYQDSNIVTLLLLEYSLFFIEENVTRFYYQLTWDRQYYSSTKIV